MKSVFERLLKLCVEVYSGKTGRNGMPYILHPLEVMNKVESLPGKIVALAHDYGEFLDVSELETIGVPEVLLNKIKLLAKTFPDDVPEDDPRYYDYIWNLLADPVCRKVKYADLQVNNGYEDSPASEGRRFTGQYPVQWRCLLMRLRGNFISTAARFILIYFPIFMKNRWKSTGKSGKAESISIKPQNLQGTDCKKMKTYITLSGKHLLREVRSA